MKKLRLGRSKAKVDRAGGKSLLTTRRLLAQTWRDWRSHWKTYLAIEALVLVPVNVLSVFAALANDSGFNAYATIAAVVMTIALGWSCLAIADGRGKPSLRTAYYEGTRAFVPYVLVLLWLLLMIVPAGMGGVVFMLGTAVPAGVLVTVSDSIFIDTVALLLTLPTLWLVTRFSLALYAVIQDGYTPWHALGYSRSLSLGRFWRVLGRLLVLGLVCLGALVVAYLPVALLGLVVHQTGILDAVFALIVMLLIWPLASLYTLKLYRNLVELKAGAAA